MSAVLPTASPGESAAEIGRLLRRTATPAISAVLFTFAGALLSLAPIYLLASVIDAVAAGDGKSGVLKVICGLPWRVLVLPLSLALRRR